ncbi:hypothetical protein IU459_01870 [Nocardia amamiensis]|uniref:Uncharacterized protein n=1 Tax=Nocardia amamiensis TaxID=404578 RepID=A0ABS0CI44_9NOCA|nr:hypothetical protein [Nocardia amamiensis]MBF6296288.1 hypothetical protein [Nocardia amamiensis]
MDAPSMPGTAGSPPDYRWQYVWPEGRGISWLLLMSPFALLAVLVTAVAIQRRDPVPLAVALIGVSGAAFGIILDTAARSTRSPSIESDRELQTFSLRHRFRPVRTLVFFGGLTTLSLGATLSGFIERSALLIAAGAIMFSITIYIGWHDIRYIRTGLLILTPHSLRISTHRCDWEFPWISLTEIGGDVGSSEAFITLQCSTGAMISRPAPSRPLSKWLPPNSSDSGPWRVPTTLWVDNANSLLSTLRYFQNQPEKLRTISTSELKSMLTPPSWEDRKEMARIYRARSS